MNRPNPKSKTKDIHIKPTRYEDEITIANFKKICAQDELPYMEAFKEMVGPWFVKHNLDLGGNPQRQLLSFDNKVATAKCKCGKPAAKHGVHLATRNELDFCDKCYREVPMRHDQKIWRFTSW